MKHAPIPQNTTFFARTFLNHPATVGESYLQHFAFALRFSGLLFMAGGAALVHALVPAFCQTTASRSIKTLHHDITTRAGADVKDGR